MTFFRQRGGQLQARVLRDGHPDQVKTSETRGDAEPWGRAAESSINMNSPRYCGGCSTAYAAQTKRRGFRTLRLRAGNFLSKVCLVKRTQ